MENNRKKVPAIQKTYDFLLAWHMQIIKMPKLERFSIGQKIETLGMDILTQLISAYYIFQPKSKIEKLKACDPMLTQIRLLIRLSKDVKAINQDKYVIYTEMLHEIGCMLGGWIEDINKKNG